MPSISVVIPTEVEGSRAVFGAHQQISRVIVERAAKSDPDAAPILGNEWFRTAKLVLTERKVPISLRMDREVVEWFKAHGKRYQSRMNAVLKAYVYAHLETG